MLTTSSGGVASSVMFAYSKNEKLTVIWGGGGTHINRVTEAGVQNMCFTARVIIFMDDHWSGAGGAPDETDQCSLFLLMIGCSLATNCVSVCVFLRCPSCPLCATCDITQCHAAGSMTPEYGPHRGRQGHGVGNIDQTKSSVVRPLLCNTKPVSGRRSREGTRQRREARAGKDKRLLQSTCSNNDSSEVTRSRSFNTNRKLISNKSSCYTPA